MVYFMFVYTPGFNTRQIIQISFNIPFWLLNLVTHISCFLSKYFQVHTYTAFLESVNSLEINFIFITRCMVSLLCLCRGPSCIICLKQIMQSTLYHLADATNVDLYTNINGRTQNDNGDHQHKAACFCIRWSRNASPGARLLIPSSVRLHDMSCVVIHLARELSTS